jgi:hypothetical protein
MKKHEKLNYPLLKRAWSVNFNKFEENLVGGYVCAAETKGMAKQQLLNKVLSDGLILKETGEKPTFSNLPIDRAYSYYIYDFEGEEMPYCEIRDILEARKNISIFDDIQKQDWTHCYIYKQGAYYRPNSSGYTYHKEFAGVYTKEEGISSAKSCSDLSLIPIDIEKHNAMIKEKILDLQTRII